MVKLEFLVLLFVRKISDKNMKIFIVEVIVIWLVSMEEVRFEEK